MSTEVPSMPIAPAYLYTSDTEKDSVQESSNGPSDDMLGSGGREPLALLELSDGRIFTGISFGAQEKAVSGEVVFQTGMTGYTESLTDPSYTGQILILTFPLIGNYGVPSRATLSTADSSDTLTLDDIPQHFESHHIHPAALIVHTYTPSYSHYLASSSLGAWLKEQGIPALSGIDTRALTKHIREAGTTVLGRILPRKHGLPPLPFPKSIVGSKSLTSGVVSVPPSRAGSPPPSARDHWRNEYDEIEFHDPNQDNLVALVSTKQPYLVKPSPTNTLMHPELNRPIRILALDVGIKFNQIRCLVIRGVEVKVIPWDYDFSKEAEWDGMFISNGPGDPAILTLTNSRIRVLLESQTSKPIFGICLGHQLLSLAAGASTTKLPYGNRGQNIPCTHTPSSSAAARTFITSQNHGYAVSAPSLPTGWRELFRNANDDTNEGVYHEEKPWFSVQFHPEARPGPRDTEFLFDVFISSVRDSVSGVAPGPVRLPGEGEEKTGQGRVHVSKVLILGSGGLSIGQAGEFDYSGSQAIKALKEEGISTILINPNIATIATSTSSPAGQLSGESEGAHVTDPGEGGEEGMADKVYFLPITADYVRKVVEFERPDGVYVSFGGQTALNVGVEMKDEWEALGVRVLGTRIEAVEMTEDRGLFGDAMAEISQPVARSATATTVQEAVVAAQGIGYPVIVRAAYALGGLGSGFANSTEELEDLVERALKTSPQVLVERSMKGWKEVEYEVVRDVEGNCVTVCNMENFDPLGIHTGDSIVIAPSQTLSDSDYHLLRTTALKVISHLGIVGECNIQYALNPASQEYCIIEVNARLSRSSALASKATGYPLAYVAAKLGLGINLPQIKNKVTGSKTVSAFEPSLDYVVLKVPRWDLKKFRNVTRTLGSSMKSVGEVMSIGRTFEEVLQKAVRAVDESSGGFEKNDVVPIEELEEELQNPTDRRLFALHSAFHSGVSVEKVHDLTKIDRWFLKRLEGLVKAEKYLGTFTLSTISPALLLQAKQLGFSDRTLSGLLSSTTELSVRRLRASLSIHPWVSQIDTVAAEFPCFTNYLYTTYSAITHDVSFNDHGVIVLGSGVYRIGSSVEFDWCAVRCIRTLRALGRKTIMINFNPETVSTDYDEADRLYFDTISLETVLDIYTLETSHGVIVSMGGQTPNNIAMPLYREGVRILGTNPENIDMAENRFKFSRLLDEIGVDQPKWKELTSAEDARKWVTEDGVGYPVLVRPSYVLSGAAMNVVESEDDLERYLSEASRVSRDYPVVISKFIEGAKEIEMDAIASSGKLVMHYISEHVENAGVHSGDATLIHPPQDLDRVTVERIEDATRKIGFALNVTGPFNIQFIAKDNAIKVIECNLRAARSFPFVSKTTGIDAITLATRVILSLPVRPYPPYPFPGGKMPKDYVGVKVAQFSFSRLSGADPVLGVEMASTGEVACFGKDKYEAYVKGLMATGVGVPGVGGKKRKNAGGATGGKNVLLSIGRFKDKLEILPSVQKLVRAGYNIFATSGTADFLQEHGVKCGVLESLGLVPNQNPTYSLPQHLGGGLIDMYINLPSSNSHRRPVGYGSKGYETRRMAVDFDVSLIMNVKCAKILAEGISRFLEAGKGLTIDPRIDSKGTWSGWEVPNLLYLSIVPPTGDSLSTVVKEGFTTALILDAGISDQESLKAVKDSIPPPSCDYALSLTLAENTPIPIPSTLAEFVKVLYIPSSSLSLSTLSQAIASWPHSKPIVTPAQGSDLPQLLLLASLHQRSIHVTNVQSLADLEIIVLAKGRGLGVTCDVTVNRLFAPSAGKSRDAGLWSKVEAIDIFSIDADGALERLLVAVEQRKLTLEDLKKRLYVNPFKVFGLPYPSSSPTLSSTSLTSTAPTATTAAGVNNIEVVLRKSTLGVVHRVVLHGKTIFLDGKFVLGGSGGEGKDLSSYTPPASFDSKATTVLEVAPAAVPALPSMGSREGGPVTLAGREGSVLTTMLQHPAYHRKNILSVKQFSRHDIHDLFSLANEIQRYLSPSAAQSASPASSQINFAKLLEGKVLASIFYEPSTRTSSSFDAAMKRLGGAVINIPVPSSSVQKGESLPDTIRTLASYSDAVVLRHPSIGSSQLAARYSSVPVINAGDGVGEHPTQALLDVFTIRSELGTVNGKTISILGDLKNGRTVHSLLNFLCMYSVRINLVSPSSLSLPPTLLSSLARNYPNIPITVTDNLSEVLSSTDVLYVTRVQKERFVQGLKEGSREYEAGLEEYESARKGYRVDQSVMARMKEECVVLHPLPRLDEIDPEVDFDSRRAVYFRQMRYGLYIRMALLASVMG